MTEAFLQYVWQHKLLEGSLTTTDGAAVVVEHPGTLNRDAGPDFFDARVVIDGVRWAGNVEIHIKASDWKQHGHSDDAAYNNVVLHVVYVHDADIVQNDRKLPTLQLVDNVPDNVWHNYDDLMNSTSANAIACSSRLAEIPSFLFGLDQERMAAERLERKADDVKRMLSQCKGNWEQVCYQLTARYLGGRINAFPFELLAKITPMAVIAKIKDNLFRVEALFFGQAGMLQGSFADDYPLALQKEYNYLSAAYSLTPMQPHLWKFFRLRPPAFPTLRISQLAALVASTDNLFSKMLEAQDIASLRNLFDVKASQYWNTHFLFDKPSPDSVHNLGSDLVDIILINAWIPLLFHYGVAHGNQKYKDQAFTLLHQLPSEANRIVRLWKSSGISSNDAADSQALIQRYNEYCSRKRCLDCQLAFRLIKNNKVII